MNLKEALQYVVGLSKPNIFELKDRNGDVHTFSDRDLKQVEATIPVPITRNYISMNTLTSLIDYIKSNVDSMPGKMIVDVKDPTEVRLYSQLNVNRERETLAVVRAELPSFSFDTFMDKEMFTIALRSKFIANEDRDLVIKFSGTVEDGTVKEYGDDGITQKATIKTGLATKGDAKIPNPVHLIPFRTFLEVQQPGSDFVFRMRTGRSDEVTCAIFEADGGAWKHEATDRIKKYLEQQLEGIEGFIVIS